MGRIVPSGWIRSMPHQSASAGTASWTTLASVVSRSSEAASSETACARNPHGARDGARATSSSPRSIRQAYPRGVSRPAVRSGLRRLLRPLLRRGLALARALLARGLLKACLEGGHQVGHRGRLGRLRGNRDLLARRLALDEVEDPLAVGVVVLVRIEVAGERVDQ